MRSNLVALQQTSALMAMTQERLATGKRVNSVVDDAQSYFSAKQGTDKADALSTLKLDMGEGLQKVKAGLAAIDGSSAVLKQMKGLANQAKSTSDATTRSELAAQFDELKDQVQSILTADANYKGTNLLKTGNDLTIQFNEDNTSNVTINSVDTTVNVSGSNGYNPLAAVGNWANDADISNALSQVTTAITNLNALATKLASYSSFIQTRMDFTTSIININKEGADALVGADMNEESANLLTLQTRTQLATTSLSLSNQAAQSILKLF
jgi:flagellin-like hook-associated protein FlgL